MDPVDHCEGAGPFLNCDSFLSVSPESVLANHLRSILRNLTVRLPLALSALLFAEKNGRTMGESLAMSMWPLLAHTTRGHESTGTFP